MGDQYLVLDLSDQIGKELGTKALLRRKGFFVAMDVTEASRLALAAWYPDKVEEYMGAFLQEWDDSCCDEHTCVQREDRLDERFAVWGPGGAEVLLYVVDLFELEDLGLVSRGEYAMDQRNSLREALSHLAGRPATEVRLARSSASTAYLLASPLRAPAIRAALAEGFEEVA